MATIEYIWKDLLWKCYHQGEDVTKDDSEIREIMGNYVYIERPQDVSHPILQKVDSSSLFLDYLQKGLYNIKDYPFSPEALYDYVNSLNKSNHIFCSDVDARETLGLDDLPFVYTYPERLQHFLGVKNYDSIDNDLVDIDWFNQIDQIIDRLYNNSGSNRAVAVLYNPGVDSIREDIPCLNWLQATIRDGKLDLHVMFRSNDLFGAFPSNMYFLTYLGLSIAERIDTLYTTFNGIHYHSSSLHIYKSNFDDVERALHD